MDLRHKVAAHTVDFKDNGYKKPHQYNAHRDKISTSDMKGSFKEFDLKQLLQEYDKLILEITLKAVDKFIRTVLKNGGTKKEEYLTRIEHVISASKGGIVVWDEHGKAILTIVRVVNTPPCS